MSASPKARPTYSCKNSKLTIFPMDKSDMLISVQSLMKSSLRKPSIKTHLLRWLNSNQKLLSQQEDIIWAFHLKNKTDSVICWTCTTRKSRISECSLNLILKTSIKPSKAIFPRTNSCVSSTSSIFSLLKMHWTWSSSDTLIKAHWMKSIIMSSVVMLIFMMKVLLSAELMLIHLKHLRNLLQKLILSFTMIFQMMSKISSASCVLVQRNCVCVFLNS